ncbi:MAG TPA: AAA family ATPase [Chitinivibrionales bacterium]
MGASSHKTLIFTDTDSGGIVHVANIKGGVGKSTIATNIASAFSRRGPTLLIDLDVQGSATVALGQDPALVKRSSWELFRRRFSFAGHADGSGGSALAGAKALLKRAESKVFSPFIGHGDITSLACKIHPSLDVIPANSDLFNAPFFFHLQNFRFNLELCRAYYTYIVLDTPSVWNKLTRLLFLSSNLNLIPVTLNALSTKSLKDYLINVKNMARNNPSVRVRIIKNEVYGHENSKVKGKTRTMIENRKFLDGLCEQVLVRSESGVSVIPQSIMFDLEIPDSAIIRDAQDEGKSVHQYHQYSAATRAFEELAKRVQYVLNSPVPKSRRGLKDMAGSLGPYAYRFAAAAIVCACLGINLPVANNPPPRPIAPQQLVEPSEGIFMHRIGEGESIYKWAKCVICRSRAVVPTYDDVIDYVNEVVDVYNKTRTAEETKILSPDLVPPNALIAFFPPSRIANQKQQQLVPVYRFFMDIVRDSCSYLTGDWCERGTGGGQPHYGIDVAGKLGAPIVSPADGMVILHESVTAGHMLGVVKEGTILFFAHMSARYFTSGQMVKKGQVVGAIGITGQTSGPHVHVGYGIKSMSGDGVNFGKSYYKLTDPKLFFYREAYLANLKTN